ncbi:hypothetical protein E4T48_03280 [Aureobasidium sp. EXF-10727]|nr:hypothetical protein E4T48_03280 [Aureobasidium sp. EXF-10727]
MALSPSDSSANARNILGRPTHYSWMQQSSMLSQPPLRASGKHVQRQAPTPIASDPDTVQYESPATVPLQSASPHPVQSMRDNEIPDPSNAGNFLPSPTPSDHNKSPSPSTARQPLSGPTAHQSPNQPAARLAGNNPISATSPAPQPTILSPSLPCPSTSAAPAARTQPPLPNHNNAPPFGPQWSLVFHSGECTKRLSDFAKAHGNLSDADLERLGILYDATAQNDWYFIILLMLSACHSLNLPSLQSVQSHLPKHSLPMFARLLGEQWDGGTSLSNQVQLFISSFPKPLDELRACLTDQSFMLAIRHIASCLYQITLNLDRVLLQCRQAETLPTVTDLIGGLGIRSLLFQRATFRFLLRNTWGSDSGPMAELAMREFMIEQQRFGSEGGQSPEVRGRQQNVYRSIFHQHVRSTQLPYIHSNPTTNVANATSITATTVQQPASGLAVATFRNVGVTQSQSPHPGQDRVLPSNQAQPPISTSPQSQTTQMEAQMRIQREMQMRARHARAHAHPQPHAVQSPLPAHFQSQPQGASLPASAYFQKPTQFQQGVTVLPHTALHDAAQMQALMTYQQQMLPQQPVLPSNSQSTPSLPAQMTRPQQGRSNPSPRLFFPGPNPAIPQPAHPDYRRSALHQAHLRSPVLVPKRPDTLNSAAINDHYRRVVGFALAPHKLTTEPVQEFAFQIPQQAIERLLKVRLSAEGDPPYGEADINSIMLRLKCCEVTPSQPLPNENTWVLLDGSWPVQAYFAVNQNPLEPRHKLHHGRYLPIDITRCVSADHNKLVVRVNRSKYDKSPFTYAVAIEVVGFATRESIKEACMKRLIPSEKILDSIKKSLISDDEDIVMQSNFTLQLYEPFSNAKIFDIPVRSRDCLHKQAFDLDVFLETRLEQQSKPPKDRISKVDAWKCPICKADSRPQSLIVDGFLMTVREALAAKNMLKTRAINVESDGSWAPIPESNDDEETEDEAAPAPKKSIEFILIDDD